MRRLVDGLGRTRPDDKIVDYAIGLEALLLHGTQGELSYRFALRGATVLKEVGEDKKQAHQDLKDFYNARSKIVHGGSVKHLNLRAQSENGERMLRQIWMWYAEQGLTLKSATEKIDRRILASGRVEISWQARLVLFPNKQVSLPPSAQTVDYQQASFYMIPAAQYTRV